MKERLNHLIKEYAMVIWVGWLFLGVALMIFGIALANWALLVIAVFLFVTQAIAYIGSK